MANCEMLMNLLIVRVSQLEQEIMFTKCIEENVFGKNPRLLYIG